MELEYLTARQATDYLIWGLEQMTVASQFEKRHEGETEYQQWQRISPRTYHACVEIRDYLGLEDLRDVEDFRQLGGFLNAENAR